MSNSYDIGSLVKLTASFSDNNGVPVNPSAVLLRIKPPGGTTQVFTPALSSDSTYYYNFQTGISGTHYYRFEGSGAVVAVADGQFEVTSSPTL